MSRTYTHFLMTAGLNNSLKSWGIPVHSRALLLGSVVPDVPLLALTVGFVARRTWAGVPAAADPICGPRFNALYFHNSLWRVGHNLFHAPLIIGWLTWLGHHLGRQKGRPLFWFAFGCGLHTAVDLLTHRSDGPLLFFPLNWSYRFPGPVSYWDPKHGGRVLAIFERLVALTVVVYWLITWLRHRTSAARQVNR